MASYRKIAFYGFIVLNPEVREWNADNNSSAFVYNALFFSIIILVHEKIFIDRVKWNGINFEVISPSNQSKSFRISS